MFEGQNIPTGCRHNIITVSQCVCVDVFTFEHTQFGPANHSEVPEQSRERRREIAKANELETSPGVIFTTRHIR